MSDQGKEKDDKAQLDGCVWDDKEAEEPGIWDDHHQQLEVPSQTMKKKMPHRGTKPGGPDLGLEETKSPSLHQNDKREPTTEEANTLQLASRGSPPPASSSSLFGGVACGGGGERGPGNHETMKLAPNRSDLPFEEEEEEEKTEELSTYEKIPVAEIMEEGQDSSSAQDGRLGKTNKLELAAPTLVPRREEVEQSSMGTSPHMDMVDQDVETITEDADPASFPGAYRIGGVAQQHDDEETVWAPHSSSIRNDAPVQQQRDAIAQAELVEQPTLAQAEPVRWWMRRRVAYASAIGVIIVGALVGTLALLLSGSGSSSSPTESPPINWYQIGQDIVGEAAEDHLGFFQSVSVSHDGNSVAVGARLNDGNGVASGSVRVFQLLLGRWLQVGQEIDGEVMIDQSGVTIDLSADGTMLAIGARGNSGNGNLAGHVRVFQLINNAFWRQIGKDIEGNQTLDFFGTSVSLSWDGRTLAAGANQYSDVDDRPGYARVFRLEGSTWKQMGQDLIGENPGDEFGFSVSLSSDGLTVAVGGPSNEENGKGSGHSCVYSFAQDRWDQVGQCIHGREKDEKLSLSLSLSGDGSVIALGAQGSNNGTGHARVYELVSDDWEQIGKDIEGEGQDDRLGSAISLSAYGNVLAVGAAQFGGEGGLPGYAKTFRREEDSWVQIGEKIVGEAPNDQFGHSISLAGDSFTVAIGAFLNDGNGKDSGHVRVYRTSPLFSFSPATFMPSTSPAPDFPGVWTQLGQDLNGEASGDQSGFYMALSLSQDGNKVAVGARGNDDGGSGAGHVRVFELADTTWNQTGQDIDGDAANDQFGRSVALSPDGSTLAVGAWANVVSGTDSGDVRVYQIINGTWSRIGQDLQGDANGDQFGVSVSLSSNGRILAVGANQNADSPGYVRVFSLEGATWSQLGQDLVGDANGDNLGHSLSLAANGTMLAVGARGHTGNAGLVRVYQFSDEEGLWNQAGQDIEGELAGDRFGFSVSLSADGSTVAAGGDGNNSNGLDSGHVRVYRLVDQEWTLLGQEIEGKSAADQFGVSVSLSSDGSALAVGADQYTNIEALPPGIEAPPGYVCVFRLEDATWLQIGDELVGEEAGENFGSSVSISGDGRTVAVGAYASGQFSGSVRIYSLEDKTAVGV